MDSASNYSENRPRDRMEAQGLSHLSVEVGHFYMDDLINGIDRIQAQLRRVAPLVRAYTAAATEEYGRAVRVSTCVLVDDYFEQFKRRPASERTDPTTILDRLLPAAAECGVRIDYLAHSAGCSEVPIFIDGVPTAEPIRLAEMVAQSIVAEPVGGMTGHRPPTNESGWLCNGRRSSEHDAEEAMRITPYRPPIEFGARNHSIFLDVELWSEHPETSAGVAHLAKRWSLPFLASVWQLLRLGMIRHHGAVVAAPQPWSGLWPQSWSSLPTVVQLNPSATPVAAYRTLSILPHNYFGIEYAVRVILDHLQLDEELHWQLDHLSGREPIPVQVPSVITDRISHMFIGDT